MYRNEQNAAYTANHRCHLLTVAMVSQLRTQKTIIA